MLHWSSDILVAFLQNIYNKSWNDSALKKSIVSRSLPLVAVGTFDPTDGAFARDGCLWGNL